MTDSLDEITAQLDGIESTMRRIMPRSPDEEKIVRLLRDIHREHPGAYVKLNDIADWRTQRVAYKAASAAIRKLVDAREAEVLEVRFAQTRHVMVRIVDENQPGLPGDIGPRLAALLAYLNYKVELVRSRSIGTNFTKVTATHDGRSIDAWLHTWPFDVTVKRATGN